MADRKLPSAQLARLVAVLTSHFSRPSVFMPWHQFVVSNASYNLLFQCIYPGGIVMSTKIGRAATSTILLMLAVGCDAAGSTRGGGAIEISRRADMALPSSSVVRANATTALTAYIVGPTNAARMEPLHYTSYVSGGTPPYTYSWHIYQGSGPALTFGFTNISLPYLDTKQYNPIQSNVVFRVVVAVSDAAGQQVMPEKTCFALRGP